MVNKAKSLRSFYKLLRLLFDPDPNKFLIIYLKDGREIRLIVQVEEEKERRLKLVSGD